jgi:hypothetical protein
MTDELKYRCATYKNGIPSFGNWTDLFTAHNETTECTEYAWVEDEYHNRIDRNEIAQAILEREG